MNNKLYHILAVGGILIVLGVASGYAQPSVALKATIPFGFKVLNEAFLAGNYTISFDRKESKEVAWINSVDTSKATNVFTYGRMEKRSQDNPYLVFRRYGDQYFLAQVWTADDDVARELIKSSAEKELLKTGLNGPASEGKKWEKVMIAAR